MESRPSGVAAPKPGDFVECNFGFSSCCLPLLLLLNTLGTAEWQQPVYSLHIQCSTNTRCIPLFLLNELRWRNDWIISHEHTSIRTVVFLLVLAVSSSSPHRARSSLFPQILPTTSPHEGSKTRFYTRSAYLNQHTHQPPPLRRRRFGFMAKCISRIFCFTRGFRNNNFLSPPRFWCVIVTNCCSKRHFHKLSIRSEAR